MSQNHSVTPNPQLVSWLLTGNSLRRLERYLVMINEYDITPIVLLSKCDLMEQGQITEKIDSAREIAPNVSILPFSNESGTGLDQIQARLQPRKTYCMVGSSGVGKTTLLNRLLGGADLETNPVREKTAKGGTPQRAVN